MPQKMTQYSNESDAMWSGWIHYISVRRTYRHSCTYLLTYLHSWLRRMNLAISPKRLKIEAKVIINGLYKDGLSIAALMCALE